MRRNQVDSILINQTKRRNTVFAYICAILIVFVLMIASFLLYTQRNKSQYVTYDESSNINYEIQYKDNEFFENNIIASDKQYIASLIENIKAYFNYNISLVDVEVDYKYTYKIEAEVIVRDRDTKKIFYDKKEILLDEIEKNTSEKEVNINEELIINYNLYNEKIKKLVKVYDLENSESYLNINMYVNVIGSCEEFKQSPKKNNVISLSIPLSEDTIAIDFIDNTVNYTNNVMHCDSKYNYNYIFIIICGILAALDLYLIIAVIRYEIKTRTAETIYEKELKKILNNYGSVIQVLGNEFDFTDYQMLRIDSFNDVLEISDKLRQPILMHENKKKHRAYFIIPSNTKVLYVFRLKVSDIKREIDEKNQNI